MLAALHPTGTRFNSEHPHIQASTLTDPLKPKSKIGQYCAFTSCVRLSSLMIPNSVTSIGKEAFRHCPGLTTATIGNKVTSIGQDAFYLCSSLTEVYFKGNAPAAELPLFNGDDNLTVYYLPESKGGTSPFAGLPPVLWNPQMQTDDASFGIQSNQFGFTISWASDKVVVVEATVDLAHPVWAPVATNVLTGGSSYFSDPKWTDYLARFYRLRSP